MPLQIITRFKILALRIARHFVLHSNLYGATAAVIGVFSYFSVAPIIASFILGAGPDHNAIMSVFNIFSALTLVFGAALTTFILSWPYIFKISNSLTDLEFSAVEQERHELSKQESQIEAHNIDESLGQNPMNPSRPPTHRI